MISPLEIGHKKRPSNDDLFKNYKLNIISYQQLELSLQ